MLRLAATWRPTATRGSRGSAHNLWSTSEAAPAGSGLPDELPGRRGEVDPEYAWADRGPRGSGRRAARAAGPSVRPGASPTPGDRPHARPGARRCVGRIAVAAGILLTALAGLRLIRRATARAIFGIRTPHGPADPSERCQTARPNCERSPFRGMSGRTGRRASAELAYGTRACPNGRPSARDHDHVHGKPPKREMQDLLSPQLDEPGENGRPPAPARSRPRSVRPDQRAALAKIRRTCRRSGTRDEGGGGDTGNEGAEGEAARRQYRPMGAPYGVTGLV